VGIVPGGMAEQFKTLPGEQRLVLTNRKVLTKYAKAIIRF
jgi:hypothetical protein